MPPPPSFFPTEETVDENFGHAITEVRTDVGWVGPSQTFHVIVLITPDEGWHTYWKNPGASGAPTEVSLHVPEGFTVGDPMYPRPNVFSSPEGQTYGYDKPAAIFIPVTAPEFLSDGRAKITATTSWLACKKICVIGEETKELLFSTHINAQGPLNKDMQLSRWSQSLPRPVTDLEDGEIVVSGNTLSISGRTTKRPIFFIGIENQLVRFEQTERAIIHENTFRIQIPVLIDASKQGNETAIVEGLLLLGRGETDPSYSIRTEVQPGTRAK
jgi:DsbC/DsbD-like thiol-disulfide interchange protein